MRGTVRRVHETCKKPARHISYASSESLGWRAMEVQGSVRATTPPRRRHLRAARAGAVLDAGAAGSARTSPRGGAAARAAPGRHRGRRDRPVPERARLLTMAGEQPRMRVTDFYAGVVLPALVER